MMTIRPGFWRLGAVIPFAILIGVFVALGAGMLVVNQPAQAIPMFLAPPLVFLIAWLRTLPVRLEITESTVRAKQGRWRGQPDKQVPRSEIRSIHYFPMIISFRGPDNTPIMRVDPHWTMRQMLRVADEIKVPLYDHRRWFGMLKAPMGQLAYDPASGKRVP
jgi:hypothetical protein